MNYFRSDPTEVLEMDSVEVYNNKECLFCEHRGKMKRNGCGKPMKESGHMKETRDVIDLKRLFGCWLRLWWVYVLCGALLAGVQLLREPKEEIPLYRAEAIVYVETREVMEKKVIDGHVVESPWKPDPGSLAESFLTYMRLDPTWDALVKNNHLELTARELRDATYLECLPDTAMFKVSVVDADPAEAAKLANLVAEQGPQLVAPFMQYGKYGAAQVLERASVPEEPRSASASPLRDALLAAAVGVVITAGAAFVYYLFDSRIRRREDLEQAFAIPVLGCFPVNSGKSSRGYSGDAEGVRK